MNYKKIKELIEVLFLTEDNDETTKDKLLKLSNEINNLYFTTENAQNEATKRTQLINNRIKKYADDSENDALDIMKFKIICTLSEYDRLDYMCMEDYKYNVNVNNNNITIRLAHGVSPYDTKSLWFVSINDIELCEEADLYDDCWTKYEDIEEIDECMKLLNIKSEKTFQDLLKLLIDGIY